MDLACGISAKVPRPRLSKISSWAIQFSSIVIGWDLICCCHCTVCIATGWVGFNRPTSYDSAEWLVANSYIAESWWITLSQSSSSSTAKLIILPVEYPIQNQVRPHLCAPYLIHKRASEKENALPTVLPHATATVQFGALKVCHLQYLWALHKSSRERNCVVVNVAQAIAAAMVSLKQSSPRADALDVASDTHATNILTRFLARHTLSGPFNALSLDTCGAVWLCTWNGFDFVRAFATGMPLQLLR